MLDILNKINQPEDLRNIEINDLYVGILKKIVYSLTSEERIGLIKELIDNCSENKIFIARLFCVLNEEEKIQIENEIIEYLKMDIYELLLIFKYLGKKNKKNIINLYIDINNIKFLCDIWKDTDKEIQYEMFETILDKILNSKYCDEIVHFISDTAECVKRDKLAFQFFSKVCEKDGALEDADGLLAEMRKKWGDLFTVEENEPLEGPCPPKAEDTLLTRETVAGMSVEEINRNWHAVKAALGVG